MMSDGISLMTSPSNSSSDIKQLVLCDVIRLNDVTLCNSILFEQISFCDVIQRNSVIE